MSKCPKCGGELKLLYLKQNCPHCGVNLPYYQLEERLEADAVKAEKEFAAWKKFYKGVLNAWFGSGAASARFVGWFVLIILLLIPVFRLSDGVSGIESGKCVGLISFITGMLSGAEAEGMGVVEFLTGYMLSSGVYLCTAIIVIATLLTAVIGLILGGLNEYNGCFVAELVLYTFYFEVLATVGGLIVEKGLGTTYLGMVVLPLAAIAMAALSVVVRLSINKKGKDIND